MKKLIPLILILALLASCQKEAPTTPTTDKTTEQTTDTTTQKEQTYDRVILSYDSTSNTITSTPGDSVSSYVLVVWMVEDFKLDYGNDFSDTNLKAALSSYINDCIDYDLGIPLFDAKETMNVYEWFDQPYPGEEFIAIASPFNESNNTIYGPVTSIRFTTKK